MNVRILFLGIVFLVLYAGNSYGGNSINNGALDVFFDCDFCDNQYLKEQVQFINYMRDQEDAQVFVLGTEENTGSGGRRYTFYFIGKKQFEGIRDTIAFSTPPQFTDDERRTRRVKKIKQGLIQYILETPQSDNITIDYEEKETTTETEEKPTEDKWNNWVFDLGFDTDISGESTSKEFSYDASVSAERITKKWKSQVRIDNEYNREKFMTDEDTVISENTERSVSASVVRALSDQWSLRLRSRAYSDSYDNIQSSYDIFPAIEYNIFPYEEANTRQIRISYDVGYIHNNYQDSTIYDETQEKLWQEGISVDLMFNQQWGSAFFGADFEHYFKDPSQNGLLYSIGVFSFMEFRVYKGLSVDLRGDISFVHDQVALEDQKPSKTDLLTDTKEVKTQYEYSVRVGISYTFGALYNNVVNQRFGRRY